MKFLCENCCNKRLGHLDLQPQVNEEGLEKVFNEKKTLKKIKISFKMF